MTVPALHSTRFPNQSNRKGNHSWSWFRLWFLKGFVGVWFVRLRMDGWMDGWIDG